MYIDLDIRKWEPGGRAQLTALRADTGGWEKTGVCIHSTWPVCHSIIVQPGLGLGPDCGTIFGTPSVKYLNKLKKCLTSQSWFWQISASSFEPGSDATFCTTNGSSFQSPVQSPAGDWTPCSWPVFNHPSCNCSYAYMHTCTHAHMHTGRHAHIHTCIHAHP